jgi:hypothetical protein
MKAQRVIVCAGYGRRIIFYIRDRRIRSQGDTSYRFESCPDYWFCAALTYRRLINFLEQ